MFGCHRHPLDIQNHLARLHGLFVDDKADVPAHHHGGKFFRRGILNIHGADVPALAKNRTPVGHLHDLCQLVGDKENTLSLPRHPLHDLHQVLNLLRRQHRGRLVKNQNLIIPVEHLQDLGPLLHTDRDILDHGIRVNAQAVLLGEGLHLFPRRVLLEDAVFGGLDPQNNIVQNAETLHQLEVLVNHADTQRVGVVRIPDLHLPAILADLPLLRLVETEEHAHQGRFPGSVLSQQGVNLTFAQLQSDPVIGDNPRKPLGDIQHFHCVIFHFLHMSSYGCRSLQGSPEKGRRTRTERYRMRKPAPPKTTASCLCSVPCGSPMHQPVSSVLLDAAVVVHFDLNLRHR